jgi:hypothetical protein
MLLGEPPRWTADAAALLEQFLHTPTGRVFLAQIAAERPSLSGSASDVNEVALQAKLVRGYELAIDRIMSLTQPPPSENSGSLQHSENYPPLDDDAAWADSEEKAPTEAPATAAS